VALAKLLCREANLLVLDEPTNDLDIETLELLEEILLDYAGTVLLVSHDRAFMDNVVTSLIVLDGTGNVDECVGGYSDWEAAGGSLSEASAGGGGKKPADEAPAAVEKKRQTGARQVKLSYKDQRELGNLPSKIEKLEQQQALLEKRISEPGFYQSNREEIRLVMQELAQVQEQLEAAFVRWDELEAAKLPND
jgi:ATP-binding cassette subfamily F protein uup